MHYEENVEHQMGDANSIGKIGSSFRAVEEFPQTMEFEQAVETRGGEPAPVEARHQVDDVTGQNAHNVQFEHECTSVIPCQLPCVHNKLALLQVT